MIFPVDGGDIYVMSEKAVGTDWKKKNLYTLRHATGCSKFTTISTKSTEKGSSSLLGKRKSTTAEFAPINF